MPVPATRYVVLKQNGAFYGLYLLVEQVIAEAVVEGGAQLDRTYSAHSRSLPSFCWAGALERLPGALRPAELDQLQARLKHDAGATSAHSHPALTPAFLPLAALSLSALTERAEHWKFSNLRQAVRPGRGQALLLVGPMLHVHPSPAGPEFAVSVLERRPRVLARAVLP